MKISNSLTSTFMVVASIPFFASFVQADVDPIIIKGSHFFYKTNGSEFFIKGVAYQQDASSTTTSTFVDPLADETTCARDIPYLQELGTNVIRVYSVNSSLDHDSCMTLLADAGIYVLADLSNPSAAINRDDPTWTTELYTSYAGVIDALAGYTNLLGFFAGNEVSNSANTTEASAYVKAAVRDMKAYIVSQDYRSIGVGYATNDDASIRENLADYFNCGDTADSIDFWGYNIYSWCGDSSYTESGYSTRTEEFSNYSVPAFFSEYGCNDPSPRTFSEVAAIYGDNMTGVWSGGVVYEYFEETNDYGLVSVSGTSVSKLSDFTSLSSRLAAATPSTTAESAYTVTNTVARDCPATGTAWAASSNLPPIASSELCDCMLASLSCVAGTDLSSDIITAEFNYICGEDASYCTALQSNGTSGEYGAYSVCNARQQLSWAFNKYYIAQSKASTACDFSGNATTQAAATASSCSTLLSQAGTAGTGTVTSTPTGTSGTDTSSSTSTKSSSAAANMMTVPSFDISRVQVGLYVSVAFLVGSGMVLL